MEGWRERERKRNRNKGQTNHNTSFTNYDIPLELNKWRDWFCRVTLFVRPVVLYTAAKIGINRSYNGRR